MTKEEYLEERADHQIRWYSQASRNAQQRFKRYRTIEIIAAGLIPFFAGFGNGELWSVILIGALGAIAAILASLLSVNQFQENWIKYRTTCEALKHEKFLFLTGTEPYNGKDAFGQFVNQIESLISKENRTWYRQAGTEGHTDTSPPVKT